MRLRILLIVLAVVVALPAPTRGQYSPGFGGSWKLTQVDPPVPAGRGGGRGAGGGGISGPFADTLLAQAPDTLVIDQNASQLTVQIGPSKAIYTLDDKTKSVPEGDVMALKTRAHWDGAKLHLHYKQGMNWGRDILSVSGSTLTVTRDLESGGQSTTRTLTYAKAS